MNTPVKELTDRFVALLEDHLSVVDENPELCPCCFKTWPADMPEEKRKEMRKIWRETMESTLAEVKEGKH